MTDKATHTQGKKWYSNPLAKTVALALGVAGMAALVQLGAKLAGTDFNILSQGGGRGLLLGLTIAGICVLLALDRNS